MEDAIQFFEKAANECSLNNPARLCTLFYRSFDAVLFKKVHSKKEIDNYITAAKKEIVSSNSKKYLEEAVEQLAEVMKTAQDTQAPGEGYF